MDYVALYPLIVIFWKIPFRIFKLKSWTLAFVFINFLISVFRSFRYGLIASAVWSISFALLYFSTSAELLYMASGVILISLSFTYARRFILAFKPNALFQLYTKIFSVVRTKGVSNFELDNELKALSRADLNTKQLETWKSHLEFSVLFNRTCLFAAKRLRDYQNSGSNIVSAIFTSLALILMTTLTFAVINWALFKIDPANFEVTAPPSFFTFFYYSFSAISIR